MGRRFGSVGVVRSPGTRAAIRWRIILKSEPVHLEAIVVDAICCEWGKGRSLQVADIV
jgi:hypothetical protein